MKNSAGFLCAHPARTTLNENDLHRPLQTTVRAITSDSFTKLCTSGPIHPRPKNIILPCCHCPRLSPSLSPPYKHTLPLPVNPQRKIPSKKPERGGRNFSPIAKQFRPSPRAESPP